MLYTNCQTGRTLLSRVTWVLLKVLVWVSHAQHFTSHFETDYSPQINWQPLSRIMCAQKQKKT